MSPTPEQTARQEIDRLLTAAGWAVQGLKEANLSAARGVALREYPLAAGHGVADYMLYADGKAIGLIEAKKLGATLSGVEAQVSANLAWAHVSRQAMLTKYFGGEAGAGSLQESVSM